MNTKNFVPLYFDTKSIQYSIAPLRLTTVLISINLVQCALF